MLEQELDSLTATRAFGRREFVRGALGSGFAAAVSPVIGQTLIRTDDAGLDAGEVKIPVGDFMMPAYCAAPKGRRQAPLVLVVSEIFGVHEHIADVARRFAKQGFFAIAPQLFVRQGDAGAYAEIAKLMSEVIAKVPDAQVMADLDACVGWARAQGANASDLAVTGFCWGGRITWLYCAHNPGVRSGVAWYGRLVGQASALTPVHPIDVAGRLHAPVLGLYGGQDAGIPLQTVEQMKAALAKGGDAARRSQIVVYPDAPHAFHADYRPSYRPDAAVDGWKRCLDWIQQHRAA